MTEHPPAPPVTPGPGSLENAMLTIPVRTGMAVAALVLGILGVFGCFPLGLIGLILGIVAVSRASSQPEQFGGRGIAIGGIVCGGLSLVLVPFFIMMLGIMLPSLARARELSKRLVCMSNLEGIGTAMHIYESDHPGQGYPALSHLVQRGEITLPQLTCPSSEQATPNYIVVKYAPGTTLTDQSVMAYEPKSNHNGEGGNVLFMDGSVLFVLSDEYDRLITALPAQGP